MEWKDLKTFRLERLIRFQNEFLPRIENYYPVTFNENMVCYQIQTVDFGTIDYYPQTNSLLIRKSNTWKKPGLQFIVQNLLKKSDNAGK